MASSGRLSRVALVRTDVSEELSASIIRVTRIGELETTLAVTSNRRTLRRNNNVGSYKGHTAEHPSRRHSSKCCTMSIGLEAPTEETMESFGVTLKLHNLHCDH
jgi:hypothetical protein